MKQCENCRRVQELERALELERANAALLGERRRRLLDDLIAENKALHILLEKQRDYQRS